MKPVQNPRLAMVLLAALVWTAFSGRVLRDLVQGTFIAKLDHGPVLVISLADVAVMVLAIIFAGGTDLRTVVRISGLIAPIGRALWFAVALFTPAAIVCALATPASEVSSLLDDAWGTLGAPFFEELGFRGLAIGALVQLCGWRFWPAALLPACLFGLAHFGQGQAPAEVAGVIAITGLGGALFGWLYVRWGFNLWPAVFVHAGLNGLWSVFDLGSNAIGGGLGNAVRIAVIGGAIGLTLAMAPKAATSAGRC